jgi:hypothetical protein
MKAIEFKSKIKNNQIHIPTLVQFTTINDFNDGDIIDCRITGQIYKTKKDIIY